MSNYIMKIKVVLYVLFILYFGNHSFAQVEMDISNEKVKESPYDISLKRSLVYYGIGVTFYGAAAVLINRLEPLTQEELNNLDPTDINRFDRGAAYNSSKSARDISDVFRNVAWAVPLGMLAGADDLSDRFKEIVLLTTQTAVVSIGVTSLIKGSVSRIRPTAYNEDWDFETRSSTQSQLSFISGHTSAAAAMLFLSAKMFHDYNPDSKLRPYFWAGAGLGTIAMGYLRYDAGRHWTTDVIVGGALGAAIGILVPESFKNRKVSDEMTIDITPSLSGVGLVARW